MIYHVSKNGCDFNIGTADAPFKTINKAASVAISGDTVVVHEGVYREWVDPKNSGANPNNRITYIAAEGEHPVIKGSEVITDWENVEGTVWKKILPNSFFGDYNPYNTLLDGDWLLSPKHYKLHLGEVYINGVSMFEAESMEDLYAAPVREYGYNVWLTDTYKEAIPNPELTRYRWFAEVDDLNTTIFCNFWDYNPNNEFIEINVRKCCFYPTKSGRNYITLSGFEIAQAACPFVPPTADQIGMVGANWSKGWIIENNLLHDAKCSAISIGREGSTGDSEYYKYHKKYSHYYQTEAVFRGLQIGWSKDNVGSHIIRNNVIHSCNQNGVVGHMGCAFSRIENNHIYNIGIKHEFYGAEKGGIKLHAAIDVVIENNYIHDCSLGTWLDWQAQGTRVTKNVYYNNNRDFMIEVTHGPCLIDNNILLSNLSVVNMAQGTAFVHNLMVGNMLQEPAMDRQTPYHLNHSTGVLGVAPIFSGDDRLINNIFLCKSPITERFKTIDKVYAKNNDPEEYKELIKKEYFLGDAPALPVWMEENVYGGESDLNRLEKGSKVVDGLTATLEESDGKLYLNINVPEDAIDVSCQKVTTQRLGAVIYPEECFENPDGTSVDFSVDILGENRAQIIHPGPFANLVAGEQKIFIRNI